MDMSVDPDAALAADETLLVLGKYKSKAENSFGSIRTELDS